MKRIDRKIEGQKEEAEASSIRFKEKFKSFEDLVTLATYASSGWFTTS